MITDEIFSGVCDIVKGILGVKSQNAQIMLSRNGTINFKINNYLMYVVPTDLFNIDKNEFFYFNSVPMSLEEINSFNSHYNYSGVASIKSIVMSLTDLQDDEKFANLISLKSKDGIGYYTVYDQNNNMHMIPMYTGFVKFNKGDYVNLNIFDHGFYWLNEFIVKKKKINYPIHIYFLTLKF